jgi:penicillin-binding protein 2
MRLQQYIAGLMKEQAGAVIVMGMNGEILSAGSYPEFNPNSFVSGISSKKWNALINDLDMPFTNKIINGLYPPGSTIKPSIGLIYLDSGISQWWYVTCSGTMKLGNRNFRCWKSWGHGKTDINKAIRESCDDYFYKGSLKVGIEKISDGLKGFGLGKKTGIDLPNEFIGTIPNRAWKRQRYNEPWYIGETLNTSIGQGSVLVTPLQIAQNTALIASGMLPKPHLARMIDNNLTAPVYDDVLSRNQKEMLPIIRHAMEEVCNHPSGTATQHITSKVKIAGKTGTAQVIGIAQATKKRLKEQDMAYYTRSHAWLTTYGPVAKPKFVVTVLIEHGGHGASAAGEIVSKIYDKLLEFGYIKR